MSDLIELRLRVQSAEVENDSPELAELARNLRAELLRIEVDDVRPAIAGTAPEGAKAVEAVAVGALVVSMAPTFATAVLDVVLSWLRRQPADIEVEIDGHRLKGSVTSEQRDALVAAYVRKTGAGSPRR